jgi:2-iminobutanoate/2-iminopropanoate deaminase
MHIQHLNPETLHRNPAFTQVVTVDAASRFVFVGGQNGIDAAANIVGDDLGTQTEQALRNVLAALQAVSASQTQVVRLAIYIVQGRDVREAFAAAQRVWGPHATAITVLMVVALANPRFLVEIEATAALAS